MPRPTAHSRELDDLFRTARCDVPTLAEQQSLRASILAAVHSGQAPATDLMQPTMSSPTSIGSLMAKLLGTLGVVAALAVGVVHLRQHSYSATITPTLNSAASPSAVPALNTAASPPSAVPTPIAQDPVVTATAAAKTLSEPIPSAALPAAPTTNISTISGRAVPPKAQPTEAALIDQARRELSSNPAHALALTETHSKLYPNGILSQEREVIAIEALARLGKPRAAERRGSAFRNQQPHSIHELRLRQVLGDAGVNQRP